MNSKFLPNAACVWNRPATGEGSCASLLTFDASRLMFDSSSESLTVLNILASAGTESPINAAKVVRILGLLLIISNTYRRGFIKLAA